MNKVTVGHIDNLVEASQVTAVKMGKKTCVVCITLPNGFEIIESAACVDPANYDHELGTNLAIKRIKDRLWELEGYVLQRELNPASSSEYP